jgi:hypothetical protein
VISSLLDMAMDASLHLFPNSELLALENKTPVGYLFGHSARIRSSRYGLSHQLGTSSGIR